MIDKSKQLVVRVDLYFGYIFVVAIVVSICEMALLAAWLDAAKFILSIGWLVLLLLATARIWKAKVEYNLTSDLQAYKIISGCFIIMVLSSISYGFAVRLASALANQFVTTAKIVVPLNILVALDVMAIGILGIYCFDKLRGPWSSPR